MRPAHFLFMLAPAVVGLLIYYGFGAVYFYLISNYVIAMPVGWKVVLVNCILITIGEDFILCVLAVMVAGRLRPTVARIMET